MEDGKVSALPTLSFTNKFSNGLVVTVRVERAEFEPPVMIASHKDFHGGIEREYRTWVLGIANLMVDEKLITQGEIIALALRNIGVK